jgi:hypothetical protein
LKSGFASDAPSSVRLARREERAYWNISVSEKQRSQADDRQADEANALLKQALRRLIIHALKLVAKNENGEGLENQEAK